MDTIKTPTFSIDLFCQVIDNYGDAGFCWRFCLAMSELGHHIDLWMDRTDLLDLLDCNWSHYPRIQVHLWDEKTVWEGPKEIVIEAFGCEIPQAYWSQVSTQESGLWFNLEYLATEKWAIGCHGLRSHSTHSWTKYFVFPGPHAELLGVLRDPYLLAPNGYSRSEWLERYSLKEQELLTADWWSIFRYEAFSEAFLVACMAQTKTQVFWIPEGKAWLGLEELLVKLSWIQEGEGHWFFGIHRIVRIPMLSQKDYSDLLKICDANWVRGEDSLHMILSLGKPFFWQPYRQENAGHLEKLTGLVEWMASLHLGIDPWLDVLKDEDASIKLWEEALATKGNWSEKWAEWVHEKGFEWDLAQNLTKFAKLNLPK
jgi:uncharacterized repeat protein (TIGR03837 family)